MRQIKIYPEIGDHLMKFVGGVYLHGSAESKYKTDLISTSKDTYDLLSELDDGIYDVVVVGDELKETQASMYFWKVPSVVGRKQLRGLICLKDDAEAIKDSEKKFKERVEWL